MADSHQLSTSRVICHIDMDCFYSQVESNRLGLDHHVPLCVEQWGGIIAVNYAARNLGINRHMRVKDVHALNIQGVKFVHVETIGVDGVVAEADATTGGTRPKRSDEKACLERYRRANQNILDVIHAELPKGCAVEKASIDEVFVDVTALVDEEVNCGGSSKEGEVFAWNSVVVGDVPLLAADASAVRLAIGAKIASRVRGAIRELCGYTSSAGIAHNKLLAKVGSALHKPDRQSLLHPASVPRLMQELPLRKLGRLGGKLGESLEQLIKSSVARGTSRTTESDEAFVRSLKVNDILRIDPKDLVACLGPERAEMVVCLAHGQDDSPVVEKERTKSMLAAKSFEPTSDMNAVAKWVSILSLELEGRMRRDLQTYQRRPKTLALTFRSSSARREVSRRSAMPRFGPGGPCRHVLAEAALALFNTARAADEASVFPCVRLALTAQDFIDCPNERESIKRFFASSVKEERKVEGAEGADGGLEGSGKDKEDATTNDVGDVLAGIDVSEQRRLLKEAQMLSRMRRPGPQPEQKAQNQNKKQKGLSSFFTKKCY
mmetsp:Transcript_10422/g.28432  ORF Transcript_10422/g.28432 Transcript_10422/m.28432 type:complete len:549 (-) Transcript_10422:907-2553(-)